MTQILPAAAPAVNSAPHFFADADAFAGVAPESEAERRARLERDYASYDAYLDANAAELAEDFDNLGLIEAGYSPF